MSLESDRFTIGANLPLNLSHTGRTIHATVPTTVGRKDSFQSPKLVGIKSKRKKTHYETKIDLRLSREISEEVEKIADFSRRSKSEILRQIIEAGVRSIRKDPAYKRYLRKLVPK